MKNRKRYAIIIFSGLCLVFLPVVCLPAGTSRYIDSGDRYFFSGAPEKSLKEYKTGLAETDEDYELLWRVARSYGRLSVTTTDKKEMKAYTLKEVEFARKAVHANPGKFEGHLYLAESLGKLLSYAPLNKVYTYIMEIRRSCEQAIKLAPGRAKPYMILGVWNRRVAQASWIQKALIKAFFGSVPDASMEDAVSMLKKAVELDSARVKYHYELALAYDSLRDYKSARAEFEKTALCRPRHQWDEKMIKDARAALRKKRYLVK